MKAHEISENYVIEGGEKGKIYGEDPVTLYTLFKTEDPENDMSERPYIGNIWEYPPPPPRDQP